MPANIDMITKPPVKSKRSIKWNKYPTQNAIRYTQNINYYKFYKETHTHSWDSWALRVMKCLSISGFQCPTELIFTWLASSGSPRSRTGQTGKVEREREREISRLDMLVICHVCRPCDRLGVFHLSNERNCHVRLCPRGQYCVVLYCTVHTLQVEAPPWFKTPIPGPAPGPHMRQPGCNGAVCYCNLGDFCNSALSPPSERLTLLLLLLWLGSLWSITPVSDVVACRAKLSIDRFYQMHWLSARTLY